MCKLIPLLALAILGLTACDKASEKEQREYIMMLKSGATPDERCAKLRRIAAAYLSEENETEYTMADIKAENYCMRVRLDGLGTG